MYQSIIIIGLLIPLVANAHWAMYDWRIDGTVDLLDQHKQLRNNDRENVRIDSNLL
jgi:hypothetical protein